ncbi:uncharacterized protein (DUF983 family) [Novosphingobium kunmingense]|uniref:Uncharacterized protein (DUF983 family) n=1 Tax=Novosphingobium kunmingense TaxID=1211806 RepID=A0A2N0I494_9SPHN|nr:DUF983 domain-containing protein [Novosphingobium kunmingense]PKB25976.1 uncharacterized protein (DUF983 family) [Novosphingobium kunmingense]
MSDDTVTNKGQPGLGQAALFGLCPDCGARTLMQGLASFAPRCRVCGLDFSRYNVGDGPAAFLTTVIGALVVVLAMVVEFSFEPPWWVHLVLWTPLIVLATILGLRVSKAALLIAEHRRQAREATSSDVVKP